MKKKNKLLNRVSVTEPVSRARVILQLSEVSFQPEVRGTEPSCSLVYFGVCLCLPGAASLNSAPLFLSLISSAWLPSLEPPRCPSRRGGGRGGGAGIGW